MSLKHLTLHNTIRGYFDGTVIPLISGGLPTQYDNDDTFAKPENARWCRFTILPGESFQVTVGKNQRYRTPGVASAQVFTPAGAGDAEALGVADTIKDAFRSLRLGSGIRFRTPSVVPVGRVGDEWQVNVDMPFQADSLDDAP